MAQAPAPVNVRTILPHKQSRIFGTLSVYPSNVAFEGQNPGERVFILLRSDVVTNFGWIWRAVLLFVLPIVIIMGITLINQQFPLLLPTVDTIRGLAPDIIWVGGALVYYSSVLTYILASFLNWYFNLYLVTSQRIIRIKFAILTGNSTSESELENIQDISLHQLGFFPSIFNYGDIVVQTAAKDGKLIFNDVPNPSWVNDVLSDLVKGATQEGGLDP